MVCNLWIGPHLIFEFLVNFKLFNSHFPLIALGLDLFSGVYINKCRVSMVSSDRTARYNKGSIRLSASWSKIETGLASETSRFFTKLEDGQSPKKEDYIT